MRRRASFVCRSVGPRPTTTGKPAASTQGKWTMRGSRLGNFASNGAGNGSGNTSPGSSARSGGFGHRVRIFTARTSMHLSVLFALLAVKLDPPEPELTTDGPFYAFGAGRSERPVTSSGEWGDTLSGIDDGE